MTVKKLSIRVDTEIDKELLETFEAIKGSQYDKFNHLITNLKKVEALEEKVKALESKLEDSNSDDAYTEVPIEYFAGDKPKDKANRELVEDLITEFSMLPSKFLNLVSSYTGKHKNEIIDTAVKSYGQTLLLRNVAVDNDIKQSIERELIASKAYLKQGLKPTYNKLNVSSLCRITGKNLYTIGDWATRKNVIELIKDKNHYIDMNDETAIEKFLKLIK